MPIAINKYRRRLSLAVPEPESEGARRRGLSYGNVLKGLDSPARRRLRFRKGGPHSMTSDDRSESANMFVLTESIREDDEEKQSGDNESVDTQKPEKDSGVQHGSLKRNKSSGSHTPSPCDKDRRKAGSFKGQASKQSAKFTKRSPSGMRRHVLMRSQTEGSSSNVVPSRVERTPEKSPECSIRKNSSYSKALSSDVIQTESGDD